jgi:hypothetical protein
MMNKMILSIVLLAGIVSAYGQEVTSATGAYLKTDNASIQYCLGEAVNFTAMADDVVLTQGFVQPKISVQQTAIDDIYESFGLSVYPNPTAGKVNLIFGEIPEDATYSLYNNSGSLMLKGKVTDQNTSVSLEGNPTGTYIIVVKDAKGKTANYKIIKN